MKKKTTYILGGAVLLVCVAGGAFYLGTQQFQPAQPDQTEPPAQVEVQQTVSQESPAPAEPVSVDDELMIDSFSMSQEDLYAHYEKIYQRVKSSNLEFIDIFEQIDYEISCAGVIYIANNESIPADHSNSYMEWRDQYHPVVNDVIEDTVVENKTEEIEIEVNKAEVSKPATTNNNTIKSPVIEEPVDEEPVETPPEPVEGVINHGVVTDGWESIGTEAGDLTAEVRGDLTIVG